MATEFDPNRPQMRTDSSSVANGRLTQRRRSPFGTIAALAALTVALIVGIMFWNGSDRSNTTAISKAPGVTTGSSTAPALPTTTGTSNAPGSR